MEKQELIPHLFRTEFTKIIAVLCKKFGIDHMEIAEDIASETFLLALETWSFKGIPENPVAWLYAVAKNKTINYLKRQQLFTDKIVARIQSSDENITEFEIDLSDENISDSQLQMLFAVCHPCISRDAQIGLALRTLCGFGIEEIAVAFLTRKETIHKRLTRAREKLRMEKIAFVVPGESDIENRLESVLTTVYLLFNEGYYSENNVDVIRKEFCVEAMRLMGLLINYPPTNKPEVNALLSLMCFHASRFEARENTNGEMVLYHDQDDKKWNRELIANGAYYLRQASKGKNLSKYHLEASIAYWHTIKADSKEKWENILYLFNLLLQIDYSPVAALNRCYAVSKVFDKAIAIQEMKKLRMIKNQFYFTLLGELYSGIDNFLAKQHYQEAFALAKTETDKRLILKKMDVL